MKNPSAMRKNVTFGKKGQYGSRNDSSDSAETGRFSPKVPSPRNKHSAGESKNLSFDASEFVEPVPVLTAEELAYSMVPFGLHEGEDGAAENEAGQADTGDSSYMSEDEGGKLSAVASKESVSSDEQEVEINHTIKGLHIKSHSGLDTRSSSIFHNINISPRLVGNTVEDLIQLGESVYVPEVYEVSVFDVGYVLPCSNHQIQFSGKQSADNALVMTKKDRMKMRSSFCDMTPPVINTMIAPSAKLTSAKTQFPPVDLSVAVQRAEDPFLPTTYGVLIEVIATPQGHLGSTSSGSAQHTPSHGGRQSPGKFHPTFDVLPAMGASPISRVASEDRRDSVNGGTGSKVHHHYHRHNPATYTYKLLTLSELLDISIKSDNDEMSTLLGEMVNFGYRFGQTNNPVINSPIQRARLLHKSQCEAIGEAPDHLLLNDQTDVMIYPCLHSMLDRHAKRSMSMLIKNNLEVLYNTDLQHVSIGIKY
jgi:hypothetical protein